MDSKHIHELAKQAINSAQTNGINSVDDLEQFVLSVISCACDKVGEHDKWMIIEGVDLYTDHVMQKLCH